MYFVCIHVYLSGNQPDANLKYDQCSYMYPQVPHSLSKRNPAITSALASSASVQLMNHAFRHHALHLECLFYSPAWPPLATRLALPNNSVCRRGKGRVTALP